MKHFIFTVAALLIAYAILEYRFRKEKDLAASGDKDALKRMFKRAYADYLYDINKAMERHDAGISMCYMLNPSLAVAAREVNLLAEKLREVDPEFPKEWVPLKEK